jgi:retron-type reverse transcriptase
MCKVFEKVLVKFIIRKTANMWTKNNQFGFLPGRSTLDAAIKVLFDLEEAYDLSFAALAIFFDFAKAFDLVPHDLLLLKLAKV